MKFCFASCSFFVVLSLSICATSSGIRDPWALNAIKSESHIGTLLILAVDYMPPKEPETLYYLRIQEGSTLRLVFLTASLDPSFKTGSTLRVFGSKVDQMSGLSSGSGETTVAVTHVELLGDQ